MVVARSRACMIDANIIYYIHDVTSVAGFPNIVEHVYEQVIIHEKVYEELPSSGKRFVDLKIQQGIWEMFDDTILTNSQQIEYQQLIGEISDTLLVIDHERGKFDSLGNGEIYSLAAATVIHAQYICSNDYSVSEVIRRLALEIYIDGDDEQEPLPICQHRFIDLCVLMYEKDILSRKDLLKGFKAALRKTKLENRSEYDRLLQTFKEQISEA